MQSHELKTSRFLSSNIVGVSRVSLGENKFPWPAIFLMDGTNEVGILQPHLQVM